MINHLSETIRGSFRRVPPVRECHDTCITRDDPQAVAQACGLPPTQKLLIVSTYLYFIVRQQLT